MKDGLIMAAREGMGAWRDWRKGDGNQIRCSGNRQGERCPCLE